jgi:hypothetical protein
MARNEVEHLRTVSDDERRMALAHQTPAGSKHKSRRGRGGVRRAKNSIRRA